MDITNGDAIKYKLGVIPFFSDYKVYLLLRYEARQQHKRMAKLMIEIIGDAIRKSSGTDKKIGNQESFYIACKEVADKEGISVAAFMEKTIAEYLNIRNSVVASVENKKKGSIFDLNRDAKR